MNKARTGWIVFLLLAGLACRLNAEVKPAQLFTDNMVFQHSMSAPVWGTADPGETVIVKFSGQTKKTKADREGNWMVRLDPLKVSDKGAILKINAMEYKNVLAGEVWLGSGQSNMDSACRRYSYLKDDPVLAKMVNGGPYPGLRLFFKDGWKIADVNTMSNFSALLFSFGLHLHRALETPVGLMIGAKGSTPSGRWMTKEMALANADLAAMFEKNSGLGNARQAFYRSGKELKEKPDKRTAEARAKKRGRPNRNTVFCNVGDLYAERIEYMAPYGIRGVLWDQGESGVQIPGIDQFTAMTALINGWRKAWGQGDFPFLHMQKPSGRGCAWDPENPVNRGAVKCSPVPDGHLRGTPHAMEGPQGRALDHIRMGTIKNAPLVITQDLAPGIHPPTKSAYGQRACRVALGSVYGHDIAICGPVYKSHKSEGNSIRIAFNHTDQGLAFRHSDNLQGFEICGTDGNWEWADAVIDGDTVIVSSKNVNTPVRVRYSIHRERSFANLFNRAGLPALMFTTQP